MAVGRLVVNLGCLTWFTTFFCLFPAVGSTFAVRCILTFVAGAVLRSVK